MKKLLIGLVIFLLVLSITGCEAIQKVNLGLKISKQTEPVETVIDFFNDLSRSSTANVSNMGETMDVDSYSYLAESITYTIVHSTEATFTNEEELFNEGSEIYTKTEFVEKLDDNSSDLRTDWAGVSFEDGRMAAIEDLVEEHNLADVDWEDVSVTVLEEIESILSSLVREKSAGGWVLEDQIVLNKASWDFKYKTTIRVELNNNEKIELFKVTLLEEMEK